MLPFSELRAKDIGERYMNRQRAPLSKFKSPWRESELRENPKENEDGELGWKSEAIHLYLFFGACAGLPHRHFPAVLEFEDGGRRRPDASTIKIWLDKNWLQMELAQNGDADPEVIGFTVSNEGMSVLGKDY